MFGRLCHLAVSTGTLKMRDLKMRHHRTRLQGWKLQDWKMQETTLYGTPHIAYVYLVLQEASVE